MALTRPVNSSHCCTDLETTCATPTSGGGACPLLLACSPLQPATVSSNASSHGVPWRLLIVHLLPVFFLNDGPRSRQPSIFLPIDVSIFRRLVLKVCPADFHAVQYPVFRKK